jgi:outer membrane protein TolC
VIEAKNGLTRLRLSTEAEVRRGYLELLFVRDRLTLLEELQAIWQSSLSITRILYQTGGGSQSDMLRAELSLRRLEQRRIGLRAEESGRVHALNRLRNHRLDEPIETRRRLSDLPPLVGLRAQFSAAKALARSPELASARVGITRANQGTALAERGTYPDLTLGAGIMWRGALPPMWQVTLGAPVPLFSAGKQSRAAAESRAWGKAAQEQVAELEQLIRLRSKERETAFDAVLASLAVYEQGLLVQSKATAESSLIEYRVGKVTFASVLEANAGYLADRESYLESMVTAHRILIAEAEVSLSPTELSQGSGAAAGMPGAGRASVQTANESMNSGAPAPAAASSAASGM